MAPAANVIVPGLRGFGESDKHAAAPAAQCSAVAQARGLIGLTWLDGAGRFSPLEAPERFAAAVTA